MKNSLLPCLFLFLCVCAPAFAGVVVTNPISGATVTPTFAVAANAPSCSSQPVAAMGYSLDNGSDIGFVYSPLLQVQVTSGAGAHTLHVKAWGYLGALCVTDVAVNVSANTLPIPANAISVSNIQSLNSWMAFHDAGTGGTSSGTMKMVASPSRSGSTRQFVTSYTGYGGELYAASFGDDTAATNFVYDVWVYIAAGAPGSIANLEMDVNQVMANGQTVIFGFQCDGWSHTWDYTANHGTPKYPLDQWVHTSAACDPRTWSTNTWHHVQISYSRDNSGMVTYKSVWLDGVQSVLNATTLSAFALGWSPTLLTNFQVDGYNPQGASNVYIDNLTIYRW
jgi:hypothetical protein